MSIWENLATESYVDNHDWLTTDITDFATAVTAFTLNQFAIPTANLNLNNKKITSLLDPTANQDAATKKYVDDSIIAIPLPTITLTGNVTGVSDITGTIDTSFNYNQVMDTSYLTWNFFDDNPSKNASVTYQLAGGDSTDGSFTMKVARGTFPIDRGWHQNFGTGTRTTPLPFFQLYYFNTEASIAYIPYRVERFSGGNWLSTINGPVQLNELTANRVVGVDSNKQITSINYSTSNTANALVQRDSNQQINCDQINLFYNNTLASSTNSPILNITNSNNCFGGMKVRVGNALGSIGARFNGYTGFASGDWFYLTYNINVDNAGTITYDNASHRASSFYFSQSEFRFAVSNSNATVPVNRLIIDGATNTIRPATNASIALGSSSFNYSGLFTNQITFPTASVVRQQIILGNFIGNNFQFYGIGVTGGRLCFNTQASGTGFEWCYGDAGATIQIMELTGAGNLFLRSGVYHGRRSSGAYYLASSTSTSFTSGVWTKIGGTTTSVNLNGFSHSNNRLTNTTGRTIMAKVTVNGTLQGVTTTTDILNIAIAKNGSTSATDELALSAQGTRVTVNEFASLATQVLISLNNNDYIEVYGRSVGATRTVEFSTLSVVIHEE